MWGRLLLYSKGGIDIIGIEDKIDILLWCKNNNNIIRYEVSSNHSC